MKLLRCLKYYLEYENPEDVCLDFVFLNKDCIQSFWINKIKNMFIVMCTTNQGKDYYLDWYEFENYFDCVKEIFELEND